MCLPLEAYWDFLIYFLRYFSTELSIKKSKKQNCNKMTKTFLITSHLDVVHIFHTLLFPTLHRCSSMASEFNFPLKNLFAQIFLAVVFSNFPEDENLSDILGQRKVLI